MSDEPGDVTMCPEQDCGAREILTPLTEKGWGSKVSCAEQANLMGGNPTLMVSLGFNICLVAMFLTTYCPVFSNAFMPLKSQTMIHPAKNGQQEENSPSAGERMEWSERMRKRRLVEQIKAENETGYGHRSLVLQRQKQKRNEKMSVKGSGGQMVPKKQGASNWVW